MKYFFIILLACSQTFAMNKQEFVNLMSLGILLENGQQLQLLEVRCKSNNRMVPFEKIIISSNFSEDTEMPPANAAFLRVVNSNIFKVVSSDLGQIRINKNGKMVYITQKVTPQNKYPCDPKDSVIMRFGIISSDEKPYLVTKVPVSFLTPQVPTATVAAKYANFSTKINS